MNTKTLFLAAATCLLPSLPAAWAGPARGAPALEGERHETLRALARHLDDTAQGALEGASDDARHGTSQEASFLASIRSFARGAHDFRQTVDGRETPSSGLASRLAELTAAAQEVSSRIRSAGALESTFDEWEAIFDVLGRTKVLLEGGDVEVPAAHVVAALSGPALDEFRRLAHDLDRSATRAHESARRHLRDYPDRGEQFLGELEYFAAQSRDLHRRADAGDVHPQEIGPIVDHVLKDAREADRRMRDARVFTSVWPDSGRTIGILKRMANLVRS